MDGGLHFFPNPQKSLFFQDFQIFKICFFLNSFFLILKKMFAPQNQHLFSQNFALRTQISNIYAEKFSTIRESILPLVYRISFRSCLGISCRYPWVYPWVYPFISGGGISGVYPLVYPLVYPGYIQRYTRGVSRVYPGVSF